MGSARSDQDSKPTNMMIAKKPQSEKFDWNKPVSMKMTDSTLYDAQGNIMKESKGHKAKGNEMDLKTKVFMLVFMIVSFIMLINAMTPSLPRAS